MRNRALHNALEALAKSAAAVFAGAGKAGADMPFELVEEPGSGTVLYRYRPLTAAFIDGQMPGLKELDTYRAAVETLETLDGLPGYLMALGDQRILPSAHHRAEAVVSLFLKRMWDESASLEFDSGRFSRSYIELEDLAFSARFTITVIAPLIGLEPVARRLELDKGLALEPALSVDAPPPALRSADGDDRAIQVLAALDLEQRPGAPVPAAAARLRFRRLLSALRLFKDGAIALGPTAYIRTDEGPWRPVELGFGGRPRGPGYWLEPGELDEFREFYRRVRRRLGRGSLAWALARFEMGCDRVNAVEGMTDHLLALRALLGGETVGQASLPLRLAALCADPCDRREVATCVEQALSLERYLMRGDADLEYLNDLGVQSANDIAFQIEQHLRGVLWDVVAGTLNGDLKRAADGLLLSEGPAEDAEERSVTRSLRRFRRPRSGSGAATPVPANGPLGWLFRRTEGNDEPVEMADNVVTVDQPDPAIRESEPAVRELVPDGDELDTALCESDQSSHALEPAVRELVPDGDELDLAGDESGLPTGRSAASAASQLGATGHGPGPVATGPVDEDGTVDDWGFEETAETANDNR